MRFELKFRDAHYSRSSHNFVGLSNHPPEMIMSLSAHMRRFFFCKTRKLNYSKEQWEQLHAAVNGDSIRELFWYMLRARDVHHIQPGDAPDNDYMQAAVALSATEAIAYMKTLCLSSPDDMQPRDGQGLLGNCSNSLAAAVSNNPQCLVIKQRSSVVPAAMTNMFGDQLEEALLKQDLVVNHDRRNTGTDRAPTNYIRVPKAHLYGCIARSVQGQRYTTINEQGFKRDLQRLGLAVGSPARVAGVKVGTTVQLPTAQGLRYMIRKAGYLTDDEIALAESDYADYADYADYVE